MENETFKKNYAALKDKYPALALKIKKNRIEENRYKIIRAETGEPNLLVASQENFILLYDNVNPFEYCKKYLEELNIAQASVVLFLGFGLGYHLYEFTRHYADKAHAEKIVVFEEDINIFQFALQLVDFSQMISHPDIHFFVGEDPGDSFPQMRKEVMSAKNIPARLRGIKIVPLPAHIHLNDEYYRKALATTRRASRQIMVLAGNDPIDSFIGIDNLLKNIKHIVSNPGINLLRDQFKGRPAITVATGPSLEKNIHLLRDIRDRALIISCDASFVPLMKRNIRPHILATLERIVGTEQFYESVPDAQGVYLAVCPVVRPRFFENKGKKLIVYRLFSHFNWLHLDKGTLPIGPAVSHMAFKIAEYLGCDPIIMIGQDLAFGEDGKTHAKDMLLGERDESYYESVVEVEGNNGKPIKTSKTWETFKVHHEEDIKYYKGLCINATEGGAKIRGARVMKLSTAVKKYCRDDFFPERIIADAISDFEKKVDIPKELKTFMNKSIATRLSLGKIIQALLEYRSELLDVYKNVVRPFLYEGADVDTERLLSVVEKYVSIMDSFQKDQNMNDIMSHTLQPQIVLHHNKLNYLKEIYSRRECLHSAQIMTIKDCIGVFGQLFVLTVDALERAEKIIGAELEEASKIA